MIFRLWVFIFLIFYSLKTLAQTADTTGNKNTFKISLEPLELPQSSISMDSVIIDTTDFQVFLIQNMIEIYFSGDTIKTKSSEKLNKFIRDKNIPASSRNVYLSSSIETPVERIKEIIDIFSKNKIDRFQLVTLDSKNGK